MLKQMAVMPWFCSPKALKKMRLEETLPSMLCIAIHEDNYTTLQMVMPISAERESSLLGLPHSASKKTIYGFCASFVFMPLMAKAGLTQISAERLRQELLKLLVAQGAVAALQVMAKAGVLGQIIPYTDEWRVMKRLPTDDILRLTALAKEPEDLKEKLRLSNAEADRIKAALSAPQITPSLREKERRALLYHLGPQAWRDSVSLSWARSRASLADAKWKKLLRLADRWIKPVLPLTGKDLLSVGFQAGPDMGAALQKAEDYWIVSDFTSTREDLMRLIKHE